MLIFDIKFEIYTKFQLIQWFSFVSNGFSFEIRLWGVFLWKHKFLPLATDLTITCLSISFSATERDYFAIFIGWSPMIYKNLDTKCRGKCTEYVCCDPWFVLWCTSPYTSKTIPQSAKRSVLEAANLLNPSFPWTHWGIISYNIHEEHQWNSSPVGRSSMSRSTKMSVTHFEVITF